MEGITALQLVAQSQYRPCTPHLIEAWNRSELTSMMEIADDDSNTSTTAKPRFHRYRSNENLPSSSATAAPEAPLATTAVQAGSTEVARSSAATTPETSTTAGAAGEALLSSLPGTLRNMASVPEDIAAMNAAVALLGTSASIINNRTERAHQTMADKMSAAGQQGIFVHQHQNLHQQQNSHSHQYHHQDLHHPHRYQRSHLHQAFGLSDQHHPHRPNAGLNTSQSKHQPNVERRAPEQLAWRPQSASEWRSRETAAIQTHKRQGKQYSIAAVAPDRPPPYASSSLSAHAAAHSELPLPSSLPASVRAQASRSSQGYATAGPNQWILDYPPPDTRYQSISDSRRAAAASRGGSRMAASASATHDENRRDRTSAAHPFDTAVMEHRGHFGKYHTPTGSFGDRQRHSMLPPRLAQRAEHAARMNDTMLSAGSNPYAKRSLSTSSSTADTSPSTSATLSAPASSHSSPGQHAVPSDVAGIFGANMAAPPAKRIKTYLEPKSDNMDLLCSAIFSLGPLKENPRGCSCPRSRCLALYCDCFRAGRRCCPITCACLNCKNTVEESGSDGARTKAIQALLARNPRAFTSPTDATEKKTLAAGEIACNCVRSRCIKKYCICFQKGKKCNPDVCACTGCLNVEDTSSNDSGSGSDANNDDGADADEETSKASGDKDVDST